MNKKINKIMIVIIIFLIMVLPSSGCVRFNNAWYDLTARFSGEQVEIHNTGQRLSEVELIKLITSAIRGDSELSSYYLSIPSKQLNGISLDEFQQYIRFLRKGISGDVHSFLIMSDEDLLQKQEEMRIALPQYSELIDNSIAYWIIFRQSGKNDEQFAVYLQKDENGFVYLSSEWVQQLLYLSNYATLYFDAIDTKNTEALAFLIDQTSEKDSILMARSAFIIDFYQNNISSRTNEFSLSSAQIDSIEFEQFGIRNLDNTQAVSRRVQFRIDSRDVLSADDVIFDVLNQNDLMVYHQNEPLFELAKIEDSDLSKVWSYRFEQITGSPFSHTDENCKIYGDGSSLLNLSYNGISVSIQGDCQNHESWNGVVRSVILSNSMYRLGSGLRPGDSVDQILIRYPFADEMNYNIQGKFDGGTVTMKFDIDQDIIDKIELSFVPGEIS